MYPIFCGQLPMENNEYKWEWFDMDLERNYTREDFWQIMAEAHAWMLENGPAGYDEYTKGIVRRLQEFNDEELRNYRGMTRDDTIDTCMDHAVWYAPRQWWDKSTGSNRSKRPAGLFIEHRELMLKLKKESGIGQMPSAHKVKEYMRKFGVEYKAWTMSKRSVYGYFFPEDHEWEKYFEWGDDGEFDKLRVS